VIGLKRARGKGVLAILAFIAPAFIALVCIALVFITPAGALPAPAEQYAADGAPKPDESAVSEQKLLQEASRIEDASISRIRVPRYSCSPPVGGGIIFTNSRSIAWERSSSLA